MQKNIFLILLLSVIVRFSNAQSAVAIGSNTPNPKAVLWLNAQGGQGLLLPSLSTSSRTGMGLNSTTEKGMLVYDNQLDKIFYWNGSSWIEAVGGGGVEADGIIGNEVTKVTTDRGLVLSGSGTTGSPLSVGLIDGTADQQVLKWNNTSKKWELGTDGGSVYVGGPGIQITGTTISNIGGDMLKASYDANTNNIVDAAESVNFPSQAANLIFASPNGSTGVPSFRALTSSDISSGTFSIARGGTALSTLPANGQLLIGNGTGYTLAGITSGTGINVTPGAGSISVATTGNFGAQNLLTTGTLSVSGATTLGNLSGVGTRMVVTNATGVLSTQSVPASFNSPNAIPKGDGTGLTMSTMTDDGSMVTVTAPSPTLRLSSTSGVSTSAASALEFTNAINGTIGSISDTGSSDHFQISAFSQGLLFNTNFANRMSIDNNGNVGIGTITPTFLLDAQKTLASPNDAQIHAFNPSNTDGDKGSIRLGVGSFWAVHLQTALNGNWLELTNNAGTAVHTWDFDSYHPGNGIGYLRGSGGALFLGGGNVQVDNYTKLGATAPAIKTALLSGTTAGTEGGLSNISFAGITTRDKIVSITVMVDWSGSGTDWIQPSWVNSIGYYFNWLVNSATNLAVVNQFDNTAVPPQRSNFILNKAIRVYITYME